MTDDLPDDSRERRIVFLARKWHIPREEAQILLETQRRREDGGDE